MQSLIVRERAAGAVYALGLCLALPVLAQTPSQQAISAGFDALQSCQRALMTPDDSDAAIVAELVKNNATEDSIRGRKAIYDQRRATAVGIDATVVAWEGDSGNFKNYKRWFEHCDSKWSMAIAGVNKARGDFKAKQEAQTEAIREQMRKEDAVRAARNKAELESALKSIEGAGRKQIYTRFGRPASFSGGSGLGNAKTWQYKFTTTNPGKLDRYCTLTYTFSGSGEVAGRKADGQSCPG